MVSQSIAAVFIAFASASVQALPVDNQDGATAQKRIRSIPAEMRTLVVGSEQDYPPFATGMADDSAGGFTVELWKAVAAEAGLRYTVRVRPFRQILQEFKQGSVDVLINLAQSDERHQFADFTVPHVVVHGAIFVRKGESRIRTEDDLAGRSIIVLNADLGHDYAVSKGWAKQLVLVDTSAEGLQLLASGKHDAMLLSRLAGVQTLQAQRLNGIDVLKIKAGFSQKFSFAVQEGQSELLGKINEGLALAKSDGTYDALYEKWFGVYEVKDVGLRDLLNYIIPLVAVFLGVAGYFFYRRQVERGKNEIALKESESRFRLMADSAPVLIWISGADNAMTWFNQTALAFRGRSLDQEIGNGWIGGVHPDDLQPCLDKFVRHVDRHEPFNMEFRLQRHDGKYRWIFESGVPRFDEKGNFLGYIGSGIDISDRVETETRLRILSTAIEQSPISVVIADVDANIEYVNPRFTETSGYTTEEAIGANPRILQSGLTPKETFHALWDKVTNGQIWHGDLVNRRKNGEIYWEEVHIAPVKNEAGVLEHYVAAKVDITELKQAEAARVQLEAQLRESQKMEALGTLAGGVAHDFNNALAMIMGNVELARRCVGRGHEALVSLEEISKASRRAKDLVQQILAFGRRQKLELKTTSLALVVVETERLVRATLPVMVSLSVDCAGDTPAVLADATQIKQLLLNLCSNAADAAQDQDRPGLVEIRLDAHVQNDARGNLRSGRYACLMVRDNGMGMNEKTRSRIFEPFFTTKPVGLGSGLGLSVVHGIVTSHNAALVVDSSANVGSTFRVYFPAVADPVPVDAEPTPVAAPIRGQGNHVLYVDDEEGIVFLMQRLLEHHGFRVSGYTDPRAALAAARANSDQFDLVVTDYNMPHLSGLVLARALRDIRADLPVLLASGYITEEVRAGAAAAGVRELIYKPNTVDDLCAAVMRFVTRHEEVVTNSA